MTNSLMWLVESVLADAGTQCSTDVTRDRERLRTEFEHRGEPFLELTLPAFANAFESCIEKGRIDFACFPSILRKRYRSGGVARGIPVFLRGFLSQVFSPTTGVILDDPSVEAVFAIRQVCLVGKKLSKDCSRKRLVRAVERFRECDAEVHRHDHRGWSGFPMFFEVSVMLWSSIFNDFGDYRERGELIPKHGPGATAEKISGNAKHRILEWTDRLQAEMPVDAFAFASLNHWTDEEAGQVSRLELTAPKDETPVRVRFVPKTSKGPRVIAIEPVCMQYAQQGILEYMVTRLENHPVTGGHLNFSDQGINQSLAIRSSLTGTSATIDLSEASDRVSAAMVSDMLKIVPDLRRAIFACRSSRAVLPNGEVIALGKFASMGSALCFPIEAMMFYTIIASTLLRERRLRCTLHNINNVMRGVYIYGDDIICPVDVVGAISSAIDQSGLKVNTAKSFRSGKFRESCGMDAFDGWAVKPVYCRRELPTNRRESEEIMSCVSLANQFYKVGYWNTASRLRVLVEGLVGVIPHVRDTSPGTGWFSYLGTYCVERWNAKLHRFEVKALRAVPRKTRDVLDGYHALLKCFLQRGYEPSEDERHLLTTVQSGTASIKRRWVTPY